MKPLGRPISAARCRRILKQGGVKRPDPQVLGRVPNQPEEAVPHLAGGLVREGEGEDLAGVYALLAHQVGDALRQHARLTAARARDDEKRAVSESDGALLIRVERRQCRDAPFFQQVWRPSETKILELRSEREVPARGTRATEVGPPRDVELHDDKSKHRAHAKSVGDLQIVESSTAVDVPVEEPELLLSLQSHTGDVREGRPAKIEESKGHRAENAERIDEREAQLQVGDADTIADQLEVVIPAKPCCIRRSGKPAGLLPRRRRPSRGTRTDIRSPS